jgi:hypothetical protein
LAGIVPLVMANQLVIVTAPPEGIMKSWQNAGVWVNIAAVAETSVAGLIETAVAA